MSVASVIVNVQQQEDEECWKCYCETWRLKRKVLSFPLEKVIQLWSMLWCIQCCSGGIFFSIDNFIKALRLHVVIGWLSVLILGFVSIFVSIITSFDPDLSKHYFKLQLGLLIILIIMTISWYLCQRVFHALKSIPNQMVHYHYLHTDPFQSFLMGISRPTSDSSLHTFVHHPCYDRNLLTNIKEFVV